MPLSFSTSQRIGIGVLLILMVTIVALAISAMATTLHMIRTDLVHVQSKKDAFANVAHGFSAAGSEFFGAMAMEEENIAHVRAKLDQIRVILGELRDSAGTSEEYEGAARLAAAEKRFRTAVYAYGLTDLGDPSRDFGVKAARQIRKVVADAIVEAECLSDSASTDSDRATRVIIGTVARAESTLIVGSVLLLIVALVVSYLLTRALARPIQRIIRTTEELGKGRLDARLSEDNNDVIGQLSQGVNRMGEQIQERSQALLAETARANQARLAAEMANARAEAANRAKDEFLANMSHEIRTPMTAILGFTETMLDPNQPDEEKLNAVYTVRRNGEHLLQIINDILDISKIEADKIEVERIRCSPVQLIADVLSLMQVRADAKNLQFSAEYAGAIPETIETDPTRLKQILVNLIGNAIKFTEVGSVRLITRMIEGDDGPMMQFDVVDTGLGMSAEQVARLFQAFTQADASTSRRFGGTGLGLHISRRLAELLGGAITVKSKLHEGSRFSATVETGPLDGVNMLHDPATATFARPEEPAADDAESTNLNCRILLAEDGTDNQRLFSFVLKKAGAHVTIVGNGKLAADTALAARDEGKPFDVILMDMQMPVMDGYEATDLLRQRGYAGPIIALTAHAIASDRQKCIDAGCDDYASKPIDRRSLIKKIQDWVQHVSAE